MAMTDADIKNILGFHPATEKTGTLHQTIRSEMYETACVLNDLLPESREKSLAFTHLQTAMMFANAAIAIHLTDQVDQ